jgi:hypothetical protein
MTSGRLGVFRGEKRPGGLVQVMERRYENCSSAESIYAATFEHLTSWSLKCPLGLIAFRGRINKIDSKLFFIRIEGDKTGEVWCEDLNLVFAEKIDAIVPVVSG